MLGFAGFDADVPDDDDPDDDPDDPDDPDDDPPSDDVFGAGRESVR
ncbi:hypothetical protein [Curtobacterium sp. MCBA15_001]